MLIFFSSCCKYPSKSGGSGHDTVATSLSDGIKDEDVATSDQLGSPIDDAKSSVEKAGCAGDDFAGVINRVRRRIVDLQSPAVRILEVVVKGRPDSWEVARVFSI